MGNDNNKVIVTDIQMSFMSMVIFMVKWAIAAIPALFILATLGSIFTSLVGGLIFGGQNAMHI